jgi:hypothetical protein
VAPSEETASLLVTSCSQPSDEPNVWAITEDEIRRTKAKIVVRLIRLAASHRASLADLMEQ